MPISKRLEHACAAISILGISLAFQEYRVNITGYTQKLKYMQWLRLHLRSQLVFCVVVIGGSVAEVVAKAMGKYATFLREYVPVMDNMIAVPSLALSTLSGVALVRRRYGWDKPAPVAIQRTMGVLAAFGVFWAVADRASQKATNPDDVFVFRTSINAISCGLVFLLRRLMLDATVAA